MSTKTDGLGSVPDTTDHYRKHTISKGVAVAMLVITVVAAAFAIGFGYQAWQAGINFSGNIPHLMASIPFDVTFLIGCTSTVVGIAATIYSIYHYVQKEKLLSSGETGEPAASDEAQGPPEGEAPAGKMDKISYGQLAYSVGQKLNGSQAPTESEFRELTDNYQLMLDTLPNIPPIVVKCVVENLYENGKAVEFKETVSRSIDGSISQAGEALYNLLVILQEQETERLTISIGLQLTKSGMTDDLKNGLLPSIKGFIWNFAADNSKLDEDGFHAATQNEIEKRLQGARLDPNEIKVVKNQLSGAIKLLRKQHLYTVVTEIEELKEKLRNKH